MVFSSFTRTVFGNTILFKNADPIKSVDFLKFYKDDTSGTFTKKEFRWSFNNTYWSSWEILNQGNFTNIDVKSNPSLYIEVRYVVSGSATVTKFLVEYITSATTVSTPIVISDASVAPPATEEADPTGDSIQSFSNFVRTQSGTQIVFKNVTPISRVSSLKYFVDNVVGPFSRREFRWSFNNTYWSSWEFLLKENLSNITVYPNKQLYLEIRYIQTSGDIGTISSFTMYFTQLEVDQYVTPTVTVPQDTPTESVVCEVEPVTTIPVYRTYDVYDADKLDGQDGDFYLWRGNHKGEQSISTITGLHKYLNGLSYAIYNLQQTDASISYFQEYIDASLAERDASIEVLFDWNSIQDISILSLFSITNILDASIIRVDASITNIYQDIDNIETSLGNLDGTYVKEVSLGGDFYWGDGSLGVTGGGGVSQAYVDASLVAIQSEYVPDVSLSTIDFYWTNGIVRIDVSAAGGAVDPTLDYGKYTPFVGDVSFYYTGDLVTQIVTVNTIGTKTVDFVYDTNDDVSTITINKYDASTKIVTFEKDVDGFIIAVHMN